MSTDVQIQLLQVKEEFDAFLDWMEPRKPQRILEIGAHHGGTALHFCHMAKELVISVDLPNGESGGISRSECEARNDMIAGLYPQFRGVLGDSHDTRTFYEVSRLVSGERGRRCEPRRLFDLLFIDGDHSLLGVARDYAMYAPLVGLGGAIAFHDINDTEMHRSAGCEVFRLWDVIKASGRKMREFNVHGAWGGIGVIEV